MTAAQWAEPPCEAVSFLLLKHSQAEAVDNLLGVLKQESLPSVGGCWQVPPNAFLQLRVCSGMWGKLLVLQFRQEEAHWKLRWPEVFTEVVRSALGFGE